MAHPLTSPSPFLSKTELPISVTCHDRKKGSFPPFEKGTIGEENLIYLYLLWIKSHENERFRRKPPKNRLLLSHILCDY